MNRRSLRARALLLATLLVTGTLATACGGGGGGGGSVVPDSAIFVPADPPAGDFSMAAVAVPPPGVDFEVEIHVDSIPSFNGAAFNVTFDPAKVTFVTFDATGSVLAGGSSIFNAALAGSGKVAVVAGLPANQNVGTATGLLITLQFHAIETTNDSPLAFEDNSAAPPITRQVQSCPTTQTCDDIEATLTYTGGIVIATN